MREYYTKEEIEIIRLICGANRMEMDEILGGIENGRTYSDLR